MPPVVEKRHSLLRRLRNVKLDNAADVTDDGLVHLAALETPLRVFEMDACTHISDCGAAQLTALRFLSKLHLSGCVKLSDVGLSFLTTALIHLKELLLEHCWRITDEGLQFISWSMPSQLMSITFSGWREVTCDGIIRTLSTLCGLRRLSFASCTTWLNDRCLRQVACSQRHLTHIDLRCCSRVTDASLALLVPLQQLEVLILDGCSNITNDGMIDVAKFVNLRYLSVGGSRVSDAGLEHLALSMLLTYLNLWGCRVSNDAVHALRNINHNVHVHK